ncbi:glycosyltransferase family 4 protein [candidate division FCPU426 bacterium]|nr:glycosyltransferase family 4 protein [candidate division FCPU426 bacterium]
MSYSVLLDGRPAQGRPRGTGVYVLRLLPALAGLKGRPLSLKVALDKRQGEDPWPHLDTVEKIWGTGANPAAWEQLVLPRMAKQAGVTLLHCTANSAPWRPRIPYVVTIHDAIFMRPLRAGADGISPKQILAHCYYRFGVGFSARRACRVMTDSEHSKIELVKKLHLDPEKVSVISLANPHVTPPLTEAKVLEIIASFKIRRPYLLGFGAVDLRKNTGNLIRAFARLPRSAADMLVLAGFEKAGSSSVPGLIKRLGIRNRVRVLDYIPERELTALFQGAAAFVYPTRMEGFGLPILQAFHLGIPVVTSRVGSIPEVAGSAVRFADPDDPRSISQEILAVLIDSNEAHRLALTGYLQAKQFTWEKTAQETLAGYMRVMENDIPAKQPSGGTM